MIMELDRVLTLKCSAQVLGVSMSTLRRMVAAGSAPKVTHLSARRLGIRESHLQEWLAGKTVGRSEMDAREIARIRPTPTGLR